MIRIFITILIFSFSLSGLMAQSKKAKKYYDKAVVAVKERNLGDAMENLNAALEEDPNYVDALLLTADIYIETGQQDLTPPLYKKALENGAPYFVQLYYGRSLYITQNYEEAMEPLKAYMNHPQAKPKYAEEALLMLESCEFALTARTKPVEYNPKNLGPSINTPFLEYFPSISADGLTLVFTHRKTEGEEQDEDFWRSEMDAETGNWSRAKPLRGFLNTPLNEGAQSITADGRIIYFAACERQEGAGSCDIYASFYQGDNYWSRPINLGPNINTPIWESQPSISPDGRTLYFARARSSFDKNIDIYYSELDNSGRWTKAQKIPGKVNTDKQETSPFIHFDNQSLYFSSNGHPGMGDLDFFVSRRQKDGSWGEPVNLGYPINTGGQEFSLIVAPDGKTGYFASDNLEDGYGMLDLYSFELPDDARATEIAYIKGTVINKKTRNPISADIEFSDLESGQNVLREVSGKDGRYFSVLPGNSDYALSIQKPGFLFYSKNFSLSYESSEKAFELNVELIPIEVGESVKLENVFFDFDSYLLDEKSYTELLSVKQFMLSNPNVTILIEGHTDNEGGSAYNKDLSTKRAKEVYDYLITQGIAKERLDYEGLGDSRPVADNQTEEGRALNRRTEIKIVKY